MNCMQKEEVGHTPCQRPADRALLGGRRGGGWNGTVDSQCIGPVGSTARVPSARCSRDICRAVHLSRRWVSVCGCEYRCVLDQSLGYTLEPKSECSGGACWAASSSGTTSKRSAGDSCVRHSGQQDSSPGIPFTSSRMQSEQKAWPHEVTVRRSGVSRQMGQDWASSP